MTLITENYDGEIEKEICTEKKYATQKPTVKLPAKSQALAIIPNNPRIAKTRKIALLVGKESERKTLDAAKAAFTKAGVAFHVIVSAFSMEQDNHQHANVEQCISTTPSQCYDGVYVFASASDFKAPKDKGAAVRFIGQAFKHCKTIGGTAKSGSFISDATMGMSDDSPGVVIESGRQSANVDAFVDSLKEHRHWDREAKT